MIKIRIVSLQFVLITMLLATLPSLGYSFTDTEDIDSDSIYTFVENAPEFRGGLEALQMYLNLSMNYPDQAMNEGIQGTVYVQFVVEKDGRITNAEVIRSVGGGCDEEALRIINEMPPWIPGSIKSKKVRVLKTFPVGFRLLQTPVDIHETYLEADRMPYMYGGQIELDNYLMKNLSYPATAEKDGITGKVGLTFVVERDGSISKVVVRDSLGYGCDEEAVRVVKKMPAWIPGYISGTPVRVLLSMTVDFPPPVTYAETMPQFPGGSSELAKYLSGNLNYPIEAAENGIQGKVWVNFIVEMDGTITNIKVTNGIGSGCDKEAIRVIENMPKWVPGKDNGKSVRVSFNIPIQFTLK